MIISRDLNDTFNVYNGASGNPDKIVTVQQMLDVFHDNSNCMLLLPRMLNNKIRYYMVALIVPDNVTSIRLLDNKAGNLSVSMYDGTIAVNTATLWRDYYYYWFVNNNIGFTGFRTTSFTRDNISYEFYNLYDTANLEGAIYIPSHVTDIYVNDVPWRPVVPIPSNGGGATHIAKVTGQLSSLSNNLSDILMVSGGGGGGLLVGDGGAKSSCVRDTADELIISITSQTDYIRNFKKKTNSEALCVLYYDSESEYYGPIIISKGNKENAKYWFNDWGTYYESVDGGSALVNGETWFISSPNLWLHYPDTNPSGFDLPILTGLEGSKYLDYIYEESEIAGIIQRILNLTTDTHIGKEAGGISGSPTNSGNQSTGYTFGQGESADGVSGGGGGLYGGYKGNSDDSGGAGSGYIGNSLVSNKKMVGYNVPTSSAESTKTESVNEASESPVSGKPKIGNGYARIKFLRSCWGGEEVTILWAGNSNKMTVQISNSDILFKLYTGDTAIYSFTAYAGSTILDADNIYVHFLIESEQQLAKPSMVYANGSVLSYNQEEPTDAEMALIYTWLSAGLPSA